MRQPSRSVRLLVLGSAVLSLLAACRAPDQSRTASYTEAAAWPLPATTAAGTPSPWNFGQIVAVATGADGNILVLHRGRQPIMVFAPDGTFVRAWGEGLFSHGKVLGIPPEHRKPGESGYTAVYGAGGCHACGAHAIRVDPDGHVWVVDAPGHVIYKLRETGDVLLQLGTRGISGAGPDTFNLPTDIAFAPNGDLYVSDGYGNARIVRFTRDGDTSASGAHAAPDRANSACRTALPSPVTAASTQWTGTTAGSRYSTPRGPSSTSGPTSPACRRSS